MVRLRRPAALTWVAAARVAAARVLWLLLLRHLLPLLQLLRLLHVLHVLLHVLLHLLRLLRLLHLRLLRLLKLLRLRLLRSCLQGRYLLRTARRWLLRVHVWMVRKW